MDALTGSYTVSSSPSVMNEAPGKHPCSHPLAPLPSPFASQPNATVDLLTWMTALGHLDRLRGTFGTLFMRMQPKLGKRLDRVRLGLANDSNSSLSVFSDHEYTAVRPSFSRLPFFNIRDRLTPPGRARRSPRLPLRNTHKRHPPLTTPQHPPQSIRRGHHPRSPRVYRPPRRNRDLRPRLPPPRDAHARHRSGNLHRGAPLLGAARQDQAERGEEAEGAGV